VRAEIHELHGRLRLHRGVRHPRPVRGARPR
jgi:hypothetical protein